MAAESVDLEFAVSLPENVSEEQLRAKLGIQAKRLHEVLAQQMMDGHPYTAPNQMGLLESRQRMFQAPLAAAGTAPGVGAADYYQGASASATSPSAWTSATSPAMALGPSAAAATRPRSMLDSSASARLPVTSAPYMQELGATAPWHPTEAIPADGRIGSNFEHLNHPTSPIGPGFLHDGSYWQQRQGSRITERKAAEEHARREREQSAPAPFRARPVPPSVTAPLYEGIQAYAKLRRSQSAQPGQRRGRTAGPDVEGERESSEERRPASRARRELRDSSEERPLPFRARPVPWCVSAPIYDQLLIEDNRARQTRIHARSRETMRSSSLPPRLEAVRARLCGDDLDPHGDRGMCGQRSSTPVPARHVATGAAPESRVLNRPLKAEMPRGIPHSSRQGSDGAAAVMFAAENLSRDVAAGPASGHGWGVSSVHGTSYGISHMSRHKSPGRKRGNSLDRVPSRPFATTEMPDFPALHEKQKRDREKYANRKATVPEPFVFAVPGRSLRSRQLPLPKDPTHDPRFHRRPRSARRPHSAPNQRGADIFAAGAEAGYPSVKALERPPVTGPPRTTAKTLQAQQHIAERLMEKRVLRARQEQHLENVQKVDPEIRARVMRAVGPVESVSEKVEREVIKKRSGMRNTMKDKHRDLHDIAQRVNRRPLLMEQTDSVARARRLALFQFRGFLKDAGVANPDAHFDFDELDELDRVRSDAAAAGGM